MCVRRGAQMGVIMRLCSIASGSSGNCVYVGSDATHLLVDTGISGKRVEQGLKELDLSPKDLDGIVNQLRIIKGVECAIFMYMTGNLEYKVSLRSCKYVDVSKVAAFFGGGGHVRAAGCTLNGTFYDVVNNISKQIELQMKEHAEESKETDCL